MIDTARNILENMPWRCSFVGTLTTIFTKEFSETVSVIVGLCTIIFTVICIVEKLGKWYIKYKEKK